MMAWSEHGHRLTGRWHLLAMRRVMKLMVMILHVAFLRFQDVLGLRGVRGFGFERDCPLLFLKFEILRTGGVDSDLERFIQP